MPDSDGEGGFGSSIGPYQVIDRLGAGGMGEVYLARDTRLNRRVALKSLSDPSLAIPDARARLLEEARAAARLTHPNIAAIHDILDCEPRPCIVMEYVQGETLAARVGRGPLPVPQVVSIGIQLADALAHAHAAGVIHRDLKPANVIVTADGVAKILDFGVARIRELAPDEAAGTVTIDPPAGGHVSGTPGYMAPEQLMGRPASAAGDIYGLGALLFELLTGRRPFVATDFMALALVMARSAVPTASSENPAVPEAVSAVVARAMAKEPGDRYQSALLMKAALERAQRELSSVATTASPGLATPPATATPGAVAAPASARTWLTRARVAAIGTMAVVVIAVVLWITGLRPRAETPIVGVLPLENLSGDPAKDYVGVGVSDSLITALFRVRPVTVISRSETGGYLGRGQSPGRIARDHGATYLVAGGLHEAGDRVRFTVQLMRPDGQIAASHTYDGPRSDLLRLQREAAGDLIAALGVKVSAAEREEAGQSPTSNLDAYADYSIGRALLDRQDVPGNIDKAIASFDGATQKDPAFALAYAGLGEACWAKYNATHDPALVPRAMSAARRAVDIGGNDPGPRVALAAIYVGTGRQDDAIAELQRALAAQPNNDNAHRLRAQALAEKGRTADAAREFEQAIAIRPNYLGNYLALGRFHFTNGRYAEAASAYRRATQVQGDSALAFQNLGAAQVLSGDRTAALENFKRALTLDPNNEFALSNVGYLHYKSGRFADAAAAFEQAARVAPRNAASHRNLGDALVRLGDTARAKAEYEEAVRLTNDRLTVNPTDAAQHAAQAIYAAKAGDTREAIAHALRATELAPDNANVLYKCAVAHALAGRSADAVSWLNRAIAKGYDRSVAREDDDLASIVKLPEVEQLLRESR